MADSIVAASGDNPPTLVDVSYVAKRINSAESFVYRLVNSGEIPFIRIGARMIRFNPQAVESYLSAKMTGGPSTGQGRG